MKKENWKMPEEMAMIQDHQEQIGMIVLKALKNMRKENTEEHTHSFVMFGADVHIRVVRREEENEEPIMGEGSIFETPCYKGGIEHKTCGAFGSYCCWCKKHDCEIGRENI